MTYSVWDPGRKMYRYYSTSEPETGTPVPKLPSRELGISPERAAWSLPKGARATGQGTQPRGMLASPQGGALQGLGDISTGGRLTLGVVGSVLTVLGVAKLTKLIRKRRHKA